LVVLVVVVLLAQVRVTGSVPLVAHAAHALDGAATATAMPPAMRSRRESGALQEFGIPNPAKEILAIISRLNQSNGHADIIKKGGMLAEKAEWEKRLTR
jgi:ABC-type nitrate/sulfonate/bicarbonate transport system substrate-binding protein